jgi:hypothetical protein
MVWPKCPKELAKQLRQSSLPWKQWEDGYCEPAMPLREVLLEARASACGEARNNAGVFSCPTCISSTRPGQRFGGGDGRGEEDESRC